ncbi:hypothetical protein Scep_027354 [Stephania cephalantha]|uniref:Uncharacterized protein n=1 Tax=Stephania cephalantha TaxID=152367 RepID=A0AAP0HKP8_9MAGN
MIVVAGCINFVSQHLQNEYKMQMLLCPSRFTHTLPPQLSLQQQHNLCLKLIGATWIKLFHCACLRSSPLS